MRNLKLFWLNASENMASENNGLGCRFMLILFVLQEAKINDKTLIPRQI